MALTEGLRRFYASDFQFMSQEWRDDGTCIVEMRSHADDAGYVMQVTALGEADEESHVELQREPPKGAHIAARTAEAAGIVKVPKGASGGL